MKSGPLTPKSKKWEKKRSYRRERRKPTIGRQKGCKRGQIPTMPRKMARKIPMGVLRQGRRGLVLHQIKGKGEKGEGLCAGNYLGGNTYPCCRQTARRSGDRRTPCCKKKVLKGKKRKKTSNERSTRGTNTWKKNTKRNTLGRRNRLEEKQIRDCSRGQKRESRREE